MKTFAILLIGLLVVAILAVMWGTLMHVLVPRPWGVIFGAIGGGIIGGFGTAATLEWARE